MFTLLPKGIPRAGTGDFTGLPVYLHCVRLHLDRSDVLIGFYCGMCPYPRDTVQRGAIGYPCPTRHNIGTRWKLGDSWGNWGINRNHIIAGKIQRPPTLPATPAQYGGQR